MAQRYRVAADHVEELACGQMVEPGETSPHVKPSDPNDKRLIDEGRLVPVPPKRQPRKQEESK